MCVCVCVCVLHMCDGLYLEEDDEEDDDEEEDDELMGRPSLCERSIASACAAISGRAALSRAYHFCDSLGRPRTVRGHTTRKLVGLQHQQCETLHVGGWVRPPHTHTHVNNCVPCKVLRDGNGVCEVEDGVVPASRDEHNLSRLLNKLNRARMRPPRSLRPRIHTCKPSSTPDASMRGVHAVCVCVCVCEG